MAGRGASRFGRGALRHEGGGGGVGDGGGAPRWALLPSGLGRLGPDVIEDVLGGPGSRCCRGAGFELGFGLGCGLRSWRAGGFGWPFGGALCFGWVVGVGFVGAWALAAAGLLAVWAGLEFRWGGVPRGLGGGVLDEDVVVVVDEVVVVVEVVESEAEEKAVGDGGGSWASGAGVCCWVL